MLSLDDVLQIWVDLVTVLCAGVFAYFKHKHAIEGRLISKQTAYNFSTGTSLFPMVMLCLSLSDFMLQSLLKANKLTLTIAGIVALLSILEDQFPKDEPEPVKRRTATKPVPSAYRANQRSKP